MKLDLSIASVVHLALLVMNMLYIFFGIRFMFLKRGTALNAGGIFLLPTHMG
jgi:hypothetical protein